MKELLGATLPFALLLACSYIAVELLHDRALVVPPPDAVAEAFTREVMTRRWDRARTFLANPDSVTRAQLEVLQSRLGDAANVDAQTISRDDTHAIVEVALKTQAFRVPMEWEGGWRVGAVPGL